MRTDFIYELRLDNSLTKHDSKEILDCISEFDKEVQNKGCKFSLPTAHMLAILMNELSMKAKEKG